MSQLRLRFLGGMHIGIGDGLLSDGLAAKAQALVCYLAVTGVQQTRDALAGLLWSDFPDQRARSNLRDALHALRGAGLAPYVQASRRLVAFNSDTLHELDTATFQHGVQESLRHSPIDPIGLQAAVDQYRGEFLAGFHVPRTALFEEWVAAQRQQYNLLAIEALQQLANYQLDAGSFDAGIPLARRLLTLDPWREESHRTLMLLLFRSGQLSAAAQQYHACRELLAEELGVLPARETQTLYENILKRSDCADPEDRLYIIPHEWRPPASNLPGQATPFIDRADDLRALDALCSDPLTRLVTLLGVGGSGKTRMALAVGERQAKAIRRDGDYRFPDGVLFAPMQALESANEIVPALCQALGFQPLDEGREGRSAERQMLDYLRPKRLLLIVDNFEQLLDGAQTLARINRTAPEVHLLVTSRRKLALQGERLYLVEGMAYPDHEESPAESAQLEDNYAAVGLFMTAARRAQRAFELQEDDVGALIRICHLVDGLPLAVELAAGWTNLLSLRDIAVEIERNVSFLESDLQDIPNRHRSMEAVFNVSWRRLSSAEQDLFSQLCVFRGGFTREAAEQITQASLRQLATLLSRALIQYDRQRDRYQIHRLLRQFGEAKLASRQPVRHEVQYKHCALFSDMLQQWNELLKGPAQLEALEHLTGESTNIRAAWDFAMETGLFEYLDKMVDGLCHFYLRRRRFHEGESACRFAEQRLAQSLAAGTTLAEQNARKRVLSKVMVWHSVFCEKTRAKDLVNDALELVEELEATGGNILPEHAFVWRRAGDLVNDGDPEGKRACYRRSLTSYEHLNDDWGRANVLTSLGWEAAHEGEVDEATRLGEEALRLRQSIGDLKGTADALWLLGALAIVREQVEESTRLLGESLDIRKRLGDRVIDISAGPVDLGMTLTWIGRMAEADEVRIEALALYETLGLPEKIAEAHVRLATSKLHIGQLEAVKQHATIGLQMSRHGGNQRLAGLATWILSFVDVAAGDLTKADALLQESADILLRVAHAEEIGWVYGLWALVAHRLGQAARAKRYCHEALRTVSGPLGLITCLMGIATYRTILLDQGKEERALELSALLNKYPLSEASRTHDYLKPQGLEQMGTNLPPDVVSAAVARGRGRSLRGTAAEIVTELEDGKE